MNNSINRPDLIINEEKNFIFIKFYKNCKKN